jgi:opacity protein-like surface antigen
VNIIATTKKNTQSVKKESTLEEVESMWTRTQKKKRKGTLMVELELSVSFNEGAHMHGRAGAATHSAEEFHQTAATRQCLLE